MLVDLDDTKSLAVIFIENSLDAGGLAGSRVTEQQTVVRPAAGKEGLRILPKLLLLDLIPDKVIQLHVDHIRDRYDVDPVAAVWMDQAECLVQSELAAAKITVEQLHMLFELFRIV